MVAMVGKTSGPTRWHFYPSSHLLNLMLTSQWMLAHGGIPTEDSYGPYLGQDGYCRADKATVGLKIKVGRLACYRLKHVTSNNTARLGQLL